MMRDLGGELEERDGGVNLVNIHYIFEILKQKKLVFLIVVRISKLFSVIRSGELILMNYSISFKLSSSSAPLW